MAGGVDDVDPVFLPVGGGGRGCDCDTPFLFLGHPVHRGIAVIHAAGAVNASGGKEDLFGYCSFSCINMGDKPYITDLLNGEGRFHSTGHWILTMKTGRWGLQGII